MIALVRLRERQRQPPELVVRYHVGLAVFATFISTGLPMYSNLE